jgi:hypothetical protein
MRTLTVLGLDAFGKYIFQRRHQVGRIMRTTAPFHFGKTLLRKPNLRKNMKYVFDGCSYNPESFWPIERLAFEGEQPPGALEQCTP